MLKIVKKGKYNSLLSENKILNKLLEKSQEENASEMYKAGFPKVVSFKSDSEHDELVQEALGPSLGKLLSNIGNFSRRTVFMIIF